MKVLVIWRQKVNTLIVWLARPLDQANLFGFWSFLFFLTSCFARPPLLLIQACLEIPFLFRLSDTEAFNLIAKRSKQGSFLESYSEYLARSRMSLAVTLVALVAMVSQFTFFSYFVWTVTSPSAAVAYSSSIDITPTWDRTGYRNDTSDEACDVIASAFNCESASATTLKADSSLHFPCGVTDDFYYLNALKFDLSTIPNSATITDVSLTVNVTSTSTHTFQIFKVTTDAPDAVSCTEAGSSLVEALADGTTYLSPANFNTTGSKTYDLTAAADSDVQARLSTTDLYAIGFRSTGLNDLAAFNSVDNATNKPHLVISYSMLPTAPSGMTHSANTTSTVSWSWTDNATGETRYDVHDAAHAPVTGCTNLAADSLSCTETGLSTNTQYTRHPNVTDPAGNTDGTGAAAYTSIETPTGISFGAVTDTSIALTATGSLSNLTSGSSGLFFQESVTATDSGWTQTNDWTKSSLAPDTQYSFQAKARNGDTDQTSLTSAATKYTLANPASVSSSLAASTWTNNPTIAFTEGGSFGAGDKHYDRYVFDQISTHVFTDTEDTWSSNDALCPGGTCTTVGPTVNASMTATGNNWYFHVRSYNGEDVATDSGTTAGPYFFDDLDPAAPGSVNDGTGADEDFTASSSTLSANWSSVTDANSGLDRYQYAIGTTAGGIDVLGYTNNGTSTTVTASGLTLGIGSTYYLSVRAVDVAGNTGNVATSNGVTITTASAPADITSPIISSITTDATSTTATIRWVTNESATAKVDYGTASTYGSLVERTTLATEHQLAITGLTPSTTYHFKITSADGSGNTASTADATFVTLLTPTSDPLPAATPATPTPSSVATPVITNLHDEDLIADTTPTIAGTGPLRSGIFIVVDRKLVRTVPVDAQGKFLVDLITPLSEGPHAIIVRAKLGPGLVSDESAPIVVNLVAPAAGTTITSRIIRDGSEPSVTFGAVAPINSVVKIYLDAEEVRSITTPSAPAPAYGFFTTIVPPESLTLGRHTITFITYYRGIRPSLTTGTTTFTKTAAESAVASPQLTYGTPTSYVVEPGDSLWSIAEKFLGDGHRWTEIQQANVDTRPSLLTAPQSIQIGWTLSLPPT